MQVVKTFSNIRFDFAPFDHTIKVTRIDRPKLSDIEKAEDKGHILISCHYLPKIKIDDIERYIETEEQKEAWLEGFISALQVKRSMYWAVYFCPPVYDLDSMANAMIKKLEEPIDYTKPISDITTLGGVNLTKDV